MVWIVREGWYFNEQNWNQQSSKHDKQAGPPGERAINKRRGAAMKCNVGPTGKTTGLSRFCKISVPYAWSFGRSEKRCATIIHARSRIKCYSERLHKTSGTVNNGPLNSLVTVTYLPALDKASRLLPDRPIFLIHHPT